jgi:uncharacterized protein YggE
MNHINRFSIRVFCIFAILVFFTGCEMEKPEPRLITATGDAEVRVAPDEVIITVGAETWDENLTIAKKRNDAIVNRALKLAKSYKIEEKHIQTDHISIRPTYEDWYQNKSIRGYSVRKTISLTLGNTDMFEDVMTDLLKSGVTHIHGVQFRTTELRKYRDQARSLAIKAAKEKAEALAKELGQKIGEPYSIREEHSGWWNWYNSWWGSSWGSPMSQNVVQNVSGGSIGSESSIALGQININAKVSVSFELK